MPKKITKTTNDRDDILSQPITKTNAKQVIWTFCEVVLWEILPYIILGLIGATIAAILWISAWFLVLLVPFLVVGYHYFKKTNGSAKAKR